jgi:molybdate transport system permease protein
MLAGNIPGKTATIPVAIYFAIQAGDTKEAIILGAIVFIIAFASLAAIAIWKGRTSIIRNVLPEKEQE